MLWGADLEELDRPGEGWTAILQSTARPEGRAVVFKVPHHGAPNADVPALWKSLLCNDPTAAVTPFLAGPQPRPSDTDLTRQCRRTSKVYCSGRGRGPAPKRRDSIIEKTMMSVAKNRRVIHSATGHVRIRYSPTDPEPNVQLRNGALHACG
jgi:hypothetical protein